MSRTYRAIPRNCYRHPKTFSERRMINGLLHDPDLKDMGVNMPNRYRRYIPHSWDDIVASAWYEIPNCKYPN